MFVATAVKSAADWVESLSFCTGPLLAPAVQWPEHVPMDATFFSDKELSRNLFKKSSFMWGKIFFGRTRAEYDDMECDLEAEHLEPECAARLFTA